MYIYIKFFSIQPLFIYIYIQSQIHYRHNFILLFSLDYVSIFHVFANNEV